MKVLRVILLIILLLLVVAIILGLTGSKTLEVERSVVVEAPPQMVFPYVSSLERAQEWSPWAEMDTTLSTALEGEDGTVGAKHTWSSEEVGSGSQTITAIEPNQRVETHLVFTGQWESEADSYIALEATDAGNTDVTWGFSGSMGFIERIMSYFMDIEGHLGQSYEDGLNNLKGLVEEDLTREYNGYTVQMSDMPTRLFMARRSEVPMDQIEGFFTRELPRIANAVGRANVEMTGMPCGLYFTWDVNSGTTDMAAAIPVSKAFEARNIQSIEVPGGKTLQIDYFGDYHNVGEAHTAMEEYMTNFNLEGRAPVIEEYVTDPGQESDTSKWLTKVYYPLKTE